MAVAETQPIACTLAPSAFKDRLAWIGALTRDALRSHEHRDLVLDLRYAPEARDRVREMVHNEQTCCSFLTFDLREHPDEIRLIITAPEAAREVTHILFEQFVAGAPEGSACGCGAGCESPRTNPGAEGQAGTRAAGLTAMTFSTGAVVCGAACVPVVMLAGAGPIVVWLTNAHAWFTGLAVLAVAGAWGWTAWQSLRARCRLAPSTLYLMAGATALMAVAVLWPLIESRLVRALLL